MILEFISSFCLEFLRYSVVFRSDFLYPNTLWPIFRVCPFGISNMSSFLFHNQYKIRQHGLHSPQDMNQNRVQDRVVKAMTRIVKILMNVHQLK